jgi:hypothetical protein
MINGFLAGIAPAIRPTAAEVVRIVDGCADFAVAIKWGQLTFAVDGDFDHWVCAVAATKDRVDLKMHFGTMLPDAAALFEPDDSKFVRKIRFRPGDPVDAAALAGVVRHAVAVLPDFRRAWQERR